MASKVTIDEQAIEKHGQWPWKRDVLAQLIFDLRNAQTGIIVMPILFSEEDRMGGDEEFCEALTFCTVIAQTGTPQKTTSNAVPRGVARCDHDLQCSWASRFGSPGPQVVLPCFRWS